MTHVQVKYQVIRMPTSVACVVKSITGVINYSIEIANASFNKSQPWIQAAGQVHPNGYVEAVGFVQGNTILYTRATKWKYVKKYKARSLNWLSASNLDNLYSISSTWSFLAMVYIMQVLRRHYVWPYGAFATPSKHDPSIYWRPSIYVNYTVTQCVAEVQCLNREYIVQDLYTVLNYSTGQKF